MGEIESNGRNHNWWANRLDESKSNAKAEKIKKDSNEDNTKQFYGKKRLDFEENVSNKRSYLEEFNVY